MPTPAATPELSPTDIEAQQAVEGTETVNPAPEILANFPSPAVTNTPAAPVAAAPVQSAPAAPVSAAAATAEPAAKPKAVRKTTAKVKPVVETVAEPVVVTEKPKRTRVAKPTVTSDEILEAAKKSLARKRATKKTDTPKGDA